MTETDEIRRKRLLFRSWHRGTKEADLLLGSFAEQHLARFDSEALAAYDQLLDQNDIDLWNWMIGAVPPPPEHDCEVLRLIQAFQFTARSA